MDSWLAAYLQRYPVPCPACTRPLILNEDCCSRCHQPITLGLGSTDLYQLSWGILMAVTGAIAGIGVFFDSMALAEGHLLPGMPRYPLLSLIIAGPVGSMALLLIFKCRIRFMRQRTFTRWAMVTLASIVLLTMCSVFALMR